MIKSNGTGGGDFSAASTWQGNTVPTTQAWEVLPGDTVTVDGHGGGSSVSVSGVGTIQGMLILANNACLNCSTLNHFEGGAVQIQDVSLLSISGNYNWYGGDLTLAVGAVILGGGTGLFNPSGFSSGELSADADRTATIRNPQNIGLLFADAGGGNTWSQFGPTNGYNFGPNGHFFDLVFDSPPAVAAAQITPIDLNFVAPGAVAEDYGFTWDANGSNNFPLVWPIVNGNLLAGVTVSLFRLSDNQWHWAFSIPGDTPIGSNVLVSAARDDGAGNWIVQQLRARAQLPWATDSAATEILAKTNAPVNITTENIVVRSN